jgi:hypothetical protein
MAFVNAGIPVVLLEAKQEALDKGLGTIRKNYESTLKKGKLTQDAFDKRLGMITPTLTYDAFADADLLTSIGGSPYADDLAASGATPAQNMAVTLRADLPGDVDERSNGTDVDGVRTWEAPLDGSRAAVQLQTVQRPGGGGLWSLLATTLLVLLVLWIAAATAFLVSVIRARARKAQRRRRALARLR